MTQLYCLGTYSNSVKLVFHVSELVECKQSAAEAKEGLRETGAESGASGEGGLVRRTLHI